MTQAPATPELVERLRDERHVMQGDGLAALLATTSEAAAALEAQQARIAELEGRAEFDEQEANLLAEHANRLSDRYRFLFAVLMACSNDRAASLQALADRYEKALREIQDLPFSATPGRFSSDIARQALSSQGRHEGATSDGSVA